LIQATKDHQITFTGYLDDLAFSSKKDFKSITPTLLEIIKNGGFRLNHKKISYKTSHPEVTGTIIHANKLWPVASMKERAKENPHVAAYIKTLQEQKKPKQLLKN